MWEGRGREVYARLDTQEVKSIGLISESNMQRGRKDVDFQVFNSVACVLLEDLLTQRRDPLWVPGGRS